jgi:hypothetical protein
VSTTPYSQFRLKPHTLADLDALAAGKGGVRSAALRDAIHYWHREVEEAGRLNAEEFGKDDWTRLAHLNDPNVMPAEIENENEPVTVDWGARFALELCGMWEGKPLLPLLPLLPMHRQEKKACEQLAKRVGGIGIIRGYAMYLCLSHFWAVPEIGGGEWWHPEGWLTPTAREKE